MKPRFFSWPSPADTRNCSLIWTHSSPWLSNQLWCDGWRTAAVDKTSTPWEPEPCGKQNPRTLYQQTACARPVEKSVNLFPWDVSHLFFIRLAEVFIKQRVTSERDTGKLTCLSYACSLPCLTSSPLQKFLTHLSFEDAEQRSAAGWRSIRHRCATLHKGQALHVSCCGGVDAGESPQRCWDYRCFIFLLTALVLFYL